MYRRATYITFTCGREPLPSKHPNFRPKKVTCAELYKSAVRARQALGEDARSVASSPWHVWACGEHVKVPVHDFWHLYGALTRRLPVRVFWGGLVFYGLAWPSRRSFGMLPDTHVAVDGTSVFSTSN